VRDRWIETVEVIRMRAGQTWEASFRHPKGPLPQHLSLAWSLCLRWDRSIVHLFLNLNTTDDGARISDRCLIVQVALSHRKIASR
jgi:hypothetical protein